MNNGTSRAWKLPQRSMVRLLIALTCMPDTAMAQGTVDPEHGFVAVAQLLRGLGGVKRILMIGAHPDDEDTSLLTVLVRRHGADAAYLALNRGEGGQNLIGSELGVGLGLLRTEELLAARRLDGARQFFTRAYDFGYSKSAAETFQFWPQDSLLADVVYVIRRFRPQIVVSIFSGTSRDGHGQHQAAGILAREAFDAAGDPSRYTGQLAGGLEPWTPLKLYRSTRFDAAATTLSVETGQLDLLLGRSYHQIAMASRSQHRSQDMGRIESLGPMETRIELLESRVAVSAEETSLFDGVDTTFAGVLSAVPEGEARDALAASLTVYARHLENARRALAGELSEVVSQLGLALGVLREAVALAAASGPAAEHLHFLLSRDAAKLETALTEAAGVIVDAFSDDDLVVPGQELVVEVQVWNGGENSVAVRELALETPSGWDVEWVSQVATELPPGTLSKHLVRLTIPDDERPTRPYFLRSPQSGAVYHWPAGLPERAQPFGAPLVQVRAELSVAGVIVQRSAEVVHRFADQARGEVRRPLNVVPAAAVSLSPSIAVWPLGRVAPLSVSVSLRGEAPTGVEGRVRLEVPDGWRVEPADARFALARPGQAATVDFEIAATERSQPGAYAVEAWVETIGGRRHQVGYSVIDYAHIRRNVRYDQAAARIEAFELNVEQNRRVGYISGAGDAVAEAMEAMGVRVDVLDDRSVARGIFAAYDVIVLGIRAYEANPTLVASSDRLLDWVFSGGTLIVQYQQYAYFNGDYAPYPLRARFPHDRVSDERAPVAILVPEHRLFNEPNRIGASDFEGWVQERGLYFPHEWDERYQPLLEMADPSEDPKRGGLLLARYGEGFYVYTGLALFRQLPAGVPGAYRLLANLMSLD